MWVRNVASRNPVRSGFSALLSDLGQSPLARGKTRRASDQLLRALPHLGSLVRSGSAWVYGDQLLIGEMASAKAFWNCSLYRYSAESCVARSLQVSPGNCDQHFCFIIADVLASCPATGNLILDFPGDELPL